ncbi:PKD domain-containing protein [Sediminitomix flava]|uniref:PKD domain-containing protein n=1 Tax=Sediminitomix flava TaxID=379075 RepID=A0A315Z8F1_SEDFL|nr:PKD domain-containing protein [Sediminitomix flava]PWJ40205.1 PKD domain-containing protein [Sediminitomix flava]
MKIRYILQTFLLSLFVLLHACDEGDDATPDVSASFVLTATDLPLGSTFEAVNTSQVGDVYEWNFGDGSPIQVDVSKTTMRYVYSLPGDYTVRLTVKNNSGEVLGNYKEEVSVFTYTVSRVELLQLPSMKQVLSDPEDENSELIEVAWDATNEGDAANPDLVTAFYNANTGEFSGISDFYENFNTANLPVEFEVSPMIFTYANYQFACFDLDDEDANEESTSEIMLVADIGDPFSQVVEENGTFKITLGEYVNVYLEKVTTLDDLQ